MTDRQILNRNLAQMLKGGVIMDVTNAQEAEIAEAAGAVAVMALERVPSDIRRDGGVARMSDPKLIKEIKSAVSIPVMAKVRIGHIVEAEILEALGIDYIDESEVLTPNVQIARALWDNVYYDVSHQKMLQTIIADMMKALREVGAEQTVVRRRNHLSVRSSMIECDYYRLLEGDSALKGVPLGPYLPDYAWASKTAAALERAR